MEKTFSSQAGFVVTEKPFLSALSKGYFLQMRCPFLRLSLARPPSFRTGSGFTSFMQTLLNQVEETTPSSVLPLSAAALPVWRS